MTRDIVAADGRLVASRGQVIDLALIRDTAARATTGLPEKRLHETFVADDIFEAFDSPALRWLVGTPERRAEAADGLAEVRFPQSVWDELDALRRDDGLRYQHALWTAIVAARLFRSALGSAPGLSRLVGGALVHDIGMRYAALRLRFKRDHLTRADAAALEDHPILGALVLAGVLGDAPAVHFALLHHARAGSGYPRVQQRTPLRGLDLVAVASAFAALIAPRSFRAQPFNARGAVDLLLDEARDGHFDERAVRLLILNLRGERTGLQTLQLPRKATGFRPPVNCHGVRPDTPRLSA